MPVNGEGSGRSILESDLRADEAGAGGHANEIARDAPAERGARDGEGIAEGEVGVLGLSGVTVVLVVALAIEGLLDGADRKGAEPPRDQVIGFRVSKQPPMHCLVHEDGQTELASSDHDDGRQQRHGRGTKSMDDHRGRDSAPGVGDEHRAAESGDAFEVPKLRQGSHVTRREGESVMGRMTRHATHERMIAKFFTTSGVPCPNADFCTSAENIAPPSQ